jgi:cystathionine beta-synthase
MSGVERNRRPYDSVLETIGWTPLIRLTRITRGLRTPVYGKADFFKSGCRSSSAPSAMGR